MNEWLAVSLGAAVGAPARYLVDRAVQSRHDGAIPWGTLTVNLVGSFVLGLLVGLALTHDVSAWVNLALGTGFCGALTTYSTFGYETFRLLEGEQVRAGVINIVVSLAGGLGAAFLGMLLTGAW